MSRSVPEIHSHVAGTLSKQATNQQTNFNNWQVQPVESMKSSDSSEKQVENGDGGGKEGVDYDEEEEQKQQRQQQQSNNNKIIRMEEYVDEQ